LHGTLRVQPVIKLALVVAITAAAILPAACDRRQVPETSRPQAAPATPSLPSVPTVELAEAQQGAIRIEPAGDYSFLLERDAVGNVSFDEDLSVIEAESTLIGAAAALDLTRKELTRVQGLGEANGIPQKELEQAIADHQTAAGALKAARDAVRALGRTDAQIEQIIATGKFNQTTSRGGAKWVVANVNESDSPSVRAGQPVTVKLTAHPERIYSGKVSRIYATLDPDTHRMTARALVQDPNDELRPGMLANVTIRIGGPIDSVAVPTTAVVREGDGTLIAWVTVDRHHFVQRPLKLGAQSEGRYQVLEGLKQGELVVVDGGVFLSNLLEAPPSD
jgi:membrane fusion protein, heavy metal efflux system